MKRIALAVFVAMIATSLYAQDISGPWQATFGDAKGNHRLILDLDKSGDAGWKAMLYLIDDRPDGFPLPSFSQTGSAITFDLPDLKISYKGNLSSDSKSVAGQMTWDGKGPVTFTHATRETGWPHDIHCTCSISFVSVEKGVKVEVLDWGGTGRPLVLLAGLGNTAHTFDAFAHKLTSQYHVYGITRRGYGESSSPPPTDANYNANRLGDDVLAVIDALHLQQRPVLVGHSIAGEELSSVASRHPEEVAGLIYLDAAYGYAFYNPAYPDPNIDLLAVRKQLADFVLGSDPSKSASDLLAALPNLKAMLEEQQKEWAGVPAPPASGKFGPSEAIKLGQRKYTELKVPILAIFASPHKMGPMPGVDAAGQAALVKAMDALATNEIKAFEAGVPSAHVVLIPNADHTVFRSNEADVLREINAFLAALPQVAAPPTQSTR
jgi:pimeloyl-ACP methyl ester carboxylesterase